MKKTRRNELIENLIENNLNNNKTKQIKHAELKYK
jgi:hypothetical protein